MQNFIANLSLRVVKTIERTFNSTPDRVSNVLADGFNVEIVNNISEIELEQIFRYQFVWESKKPFFVIWVNKQKERSWFEFAIVPETIESNWYMLVHPNDTSHLILAKEWKWIRFDWKRDFVNECNGDAWWYWGGTFQVDKFTSAHAVLYSEISSARIREIFQDVRGA